MKTQKKKPKNLHKREILLIFADGMQEMQAELPYEG